MARKKKSPLKSEETIAESDSNTTDNATTSGNDSNVMQMDTSALSVEPKKDILSDNTETKKVRKLNPRQKPSDFTYIAKGKKTVPTKPQKDITKQRKHRFRPGTVALREIRKYQHSYDLILPRLPFSRICREISQDYKTDVRWTSDALSLLQEAAEAVLVDVFTDTGDITVNRKQVTIQLKDMHLVRYGRFWAKSLTPYDHVNGRISPPAYERTPSKSEREEQGRVHSFLRAPSAIFKNKKRHSSKAPKDYSKDKLSKENVNDKTKKGGVDIKQQKSTTDVKKQKVEVDTDNKKDVVDTDKQNSDTENVQQKTDTDKQQKTDTDKQQKSDTDNLSVKSNMDEVLSESKAELLKKKKKKNEPKSELLNKKKQKIPKKKDVHSDTEENAKDSSDETAEPQVESHTTKDTSLVTETTETDKIHQNQTIDTKSFQDESQLKEEMQFDDTPVPVASASTSSIKKLLQTKADTKKKTPLAKKR